MISVVICTMNRADSLVGCLHSIRAAATNLQDRLELIIVDNNSTDETKAVSIEFAHKARFQVHYIFEPTAGLSRCRNIGIESASNPIIAFIDDDCVVAKDWLQEIDHVFGVNTKLTAVGGRVDLYDEADYPVSIRHFDESIAITNAVDVQKYLIGCNMAFRCSVFDQVGLFDTRLGAGTRIGSAEDLDFFYRCLKHELELGYSSDVRVYHAHGRRTEKAVRELNKRYLTGRGAFYWKHIIRGDQEMLRRFYWEVIGLLRTRKVAEQNELLLSRTALGSIFVGILCYMFRR